MYAMANNVRARSRSVVRHRPCALVRQSGSDGPVLCRVVRRLCFLVDFGRGPLQLQPVLLSILVGAIRPDSVPFYIVSRGAHRVLLGVIRTGAHIAITVAQLPNANPTNSFRQRQRQVASDGLGRQSGLRRRLQ